MELQEALRQRRSIRKFTDEAVSQEMIDALMHAAMSGPSACNRCPWEFYVITNEDKLNELNGATRFTKMKSKLAIVVCGSLSRALPMQLASYWVQDCSAATENILLCATDLGLGAVWCGIHPQKRAEKYVSDVLGLSARQVPLNIIFIGHPNEEAEPRDQYNEKHVHYVR